MINVRFEQPSDAARVREVNEQAFDSQIEARIVESLRGAPDCISLVATKNDLVIGHILFTPVSLEPPVGFRVAGLGPMSVRPEDQRAGVGGQLVRAGLEACRQHGYSAVVVVGHPECIRASIRARAYARVDAARFRRASGRVHGRRARGGCARAFEGAVRYPSEFAEA